MAKQKSRWGFIIGVLIILIIASYIFVGLISVSLGDGFQQGNVAVIPIDGIILTQSSADLFGNKVSDSSQIVADIENAVRNPQIKAILLEINSPGGAPVATDEIATAVKQANITTVAWIREVGASGAYWIATSADHIVANRMSITGSIGVIGSYLEFSGLLTDFNVSYERMVAGKYKDMGIPFRQLSPEERKLFQKKLDLMHQEFKNAVQENRKLSLGQVEAISTGEFYLGMEAINFGMVDELGGKNEVLAYIEAQIEEKPELIRYEHQPSLFDMLAGLTFDKGFGINDRSQIGSFS